MTTNTGEPKTNPFLEDETNRLQRLFNAMARQDREQRSRYHLTLGQAIRFFAETAQVSPTLPVWIVGESMDRRAAPCSVGFVGSYRGYYDDLAIAPAFNGRETVAGTLAKLESALGATFTGYKGGEFVMDDATPLWVAGYGHASGLAVMQVLREGDSVCLCVKKVS